MKLLEILNELFIAQIDKDRIKSWGEEIVEEYEAGPFTIFLTRSKYGGQYQVGLTSNSMECSSREAQHAKVGCASPKEIMESYPKIVAKVASWIEQFGKLMVGSWNEKKVRQYHTIFTHFGLNCSEISQRMGGFAFSVDKLRQH